MNAFGSVRLVCFPPLSIARLLEGKAGSNGNVGIGKTPAYKLDVNGDINTSGDIRKNGNSYINPSYFFEQNYSLRPIKAVKKYTERNKHLPHVPSTAQVNREVLRFFEQNRVTLKN